MSDNESGTDPHAQVGELERGFRPTTPLKIALDEVARVLQRELPTTSAQTLSGLVIEHLRGFPEVGDRVSIELPIDPADLSGTDTPETERLVIDVIEVATHVPARLRIGIEVAR